ncbi:MAG: hypothetical protein Q8K75_12335 [Chlamydiales bacterium]|nr:hypothetical protein [Chlamydiales bacterium]
MHSSTDSFDPLISSSFLNLSSGSNLTDSTDSLSSSTSSIDSDDETAFQIESVTNADPNDQTNVNIIEGAGPGNFPARWVWGLIEKDRNRVVDLSFRPEEGPTGGVRYEKYSMHDPDLDVIMVRLHFRLTYLDKHGAETYEDKEFLMYTRIPYPDETDPQKEAEAAARANLAIRAYTFPVLSSMDPKQRVDELWNSVSDIVEAKVFHVSRSDYDKAKNRFKKAKVYYGGGLEHNFTLSKVSEKRELIFTGKDYCFGPKVTKRNEGQKTMQVDSKYYQTVATPCFNNNATLHFLQSQSPDDISTALIRAQQMEPKAYLARLRREHERDQAEYDGVKKLLLEPRGWVPSYILHSIKPSPEFSKFQNEISPSIWNRFKRAIGLNQGYEYQKHKLEKNVQKANNALQQIDAQIAVAPSGTQAERDALQTMQDERKALQNNCNDANKALAEADNNFGIEKGKIEGWLGMMEAIHLRMARRLEQMDSLLERTMADGGLGLYEPGSTELDAAERTEWIATLSTINKEIRTNVVYLQRALSSLQGAGLDFNEEKQYSSNALADDIDDIQERVVNLQTLIGDHLDAARTTDAAYRSDTSNVAAKKAHQDAMSVLQGDQDHVRNLVAEIDQDTVSATKLLQRPELDDAQRDRLQICLGNLQQNRQDVLDCDTWIRNGLRDVAISDDRFPGDNV